MFVCREGGGEEMQQQRSVSISTHRPDVHAEARLAALPKPADTHANNPLMWPMISSLTGLNINLLPEKIPH